MPTSNPAAILRTYLEKTLEEWADTIKDAVLDWDPINERARDGFPSPLPRLSPEPFVEALRGEVEVMLQAIAQVVNESPAGTIDPVAVRRVQGLFAGLVNRSIVLGLQMRLDAAEAAPEVPIPSPRTEWAKRYRGMMTTVPHPGRRAAEPAAPTEELLPSQQATE